MAGSRLADCASADASPSQRCGPGASCAEGIAPLPSPLEWWEAAELADEDQGATRAAHRAQASPEGSTSASRTVIDAEVDGDAALGVASGVADTGKVDVLSRVAPGQQLRPETKKLPAYQRLHAAHAAKLERLAQLKEQAEREALDREQALQRESRRAHAEAASVDAACSRLYSEADQRRRRFEERRKQQEEQDFDTITSQSIFSQLPSALMDDDRSEPCWERLYASASQREHKLEQERQKALEDQERWLEENSIHRSVPSEVSVNVSERLYAEGKQQARRLEQLRQEDVDEERRRLAEDSIHSRARHAAAAAGAAAGCTVAVAAAAAEESARRLYEDSRHRARRHEERGRQEQQQRMNDQVRHRSSSSSALPDPGRFDNLFGDASRRDENLRVCQAQIEREELEKLKSESVHAAGQRRIKGEVELQQVFERVSQARRTTQHARYPVDTTTSGSCNGDSSGPTTTNGDSLAASASTDGDFADKVSASSGGGIDQSVSSRFHDRKQAFGAAPAAVARTSRTPPRKSGQAFATAAVAAAAAVSQAGARRTPPRGPSSSSTAVGASASIDHDCSSSSSAIIRSSSSTPALHSWTVAPPAAPGASGLTPPRQRPQGMDHKFRDMPTQGSACGRNASYVAAPCTGSVTAGAAMADGSSSGCHQASARRTPRRSSSGTALASSTVWVLPPEADPTKAAADFRAAAALVAQQSMAQSSAVVASAAASNSSQASTTALRRASTPGSLYAASHLSAGGAPISRTRGSGATSQAAEAVAEPTARSATRSSSMVGLHGSRPSRGVTPPPSCDARRARTPPRQWAPGAKQTNRLQGSAAATPVFGTECHAATPQNCAARRAITPPRQWAPSANQTSRPQASATATPVFGTEGHAATPSSGAARRATTPPRQWAPGANQANRPQASATTTPGFGTEGRAATPPNCAARRAVTPPRQWAPGANQASRPQASASATPVFGTESRAATPSRSSGVASVRAVTPPRRTPR